MADPKTVPLQPWAAAVLENRRNFQLEPHTRCKPSGGIRQFLTPYGVEFVELPDLERIYIFDIGGPHTYRTTIARMGGVYLIPVAGGEVKRLTEALKRDVL